MYVCTTYKLPKQREGWYDTVYPNSSFSANCNYYYLYYIYYIIIIIFYPEVTALTQFKDYALNTDHIILCFKYKRKQNSQLLYLSTTTADIFGMSYVKIANPHRL